MWNALNRTIDKGGLDELFNGLLERERRPPLDPAAKLLLGFDTNAMFRLGLGAQGANALDFIARQQQGRVVVPGQAVLEVWNNFLAGVEPRAKSVARKLTELEAELELIGQELGPLGESAKLALSELIESHGEWTDGKALADFDGTVRTLLDVGSYTVPRQQFFQLGQVRKQTKTPPGFRDEATNLGDFFIWADFLYGVASSDLSNVDAVVLVTNDQKPDWSRNGVAHPVLVSEARVVADRDFRLWTLERFHSFVKSIAS